MTNPASTPPAAAPASKLAPRPGSITISVVDAGGSRGPIAGALVALFDESVGIDRLKLLTSWPHDWPRPVAHGLTGADGRVRLTGLAPGTYTAVYGHEPGALPQSCELRSGCEASLCFEIALDASVTMEFEGPDCQPVSCDRPRVGDRARLTAEFRNRRPDTEAFFMRWPDGSRADRLDPWRAVYAIGHEGGARLGFELVAAPLPGSFADSPAAIAFEQTFDADERPAAPISGAVHVSMTRTETEPTADLKLWGAIRASTEQLAFARYDAFMDQLLCSDGAARGRRERKRFDQLLERRFLPFTDTDAYRLMKTATEAFVMVNCGVVQLDDDMRADPSVLSDFRAYLDRRDLPRPAAARVLETVDGVPMLPYLAIIRRKLPDVPIGGPRDADGIDADGCDAFIREKLRNPCLLELIWSYWQEEGMLVQTTNAILRRFQNVRGALDPDPLANLEVNPLRPLNNLLWGLIQDEQHRLTVARRNAEYDHHYGLRLEGRAVAGFRGADTRSKFIEALHHLLRLCTEFYKQDDDTTVKADAFGVLNALKELHLILSQGAHSQFGDLPATARIEMLMQQWLLARPEFREFLPSRAMVAYPEPWMDRVDAMKKLQGWTDTSVIHFHNLAVFGEQILLAIRWGAWSTVFEPTQAFNFARFWRPQIQGYIHAYRAATGVELGAAAVAQQVDATLPALLLQRRLAAQRRSA